ncbi:ABC transporter permease [Pseudomarimonas salicorniae]|uniref:ABC transporter permease n=1 Tax=Pseudomarimonas salicorniae TaxID=2933270 RepID=A0ABT0GG92_9GAMM|nr:ABC transporter permease [Lysobacter sp. CAU 1642]MCK7593551.1 ABC transporter permease [Lysobacter sp. CAU 1642]
MNALSPARAPVWRSYLAETRAEALRTWRTPAFVLPTLLFPLVFYVLFALLLPGRWGNLDKPLYLLATYGVFGIMGPALFGFGVGVAVERQNGWLALRQVSPMPPGAYLFAKLCMSLGFGLLVVLLLSAAAVLAGEFNVDPLRWALLLGVLTIGSLPFCAIGLWIGSWARGEGAAAIVNVIFLPMAVLSGLWIPLQVFPEWLADSAVIWPAWHLAQIALAVVGQAEDVPVGWHAAVLALTSIGFLALAARRLGRED